MDYTNIYNEILDRIAEIPEDKMSVVVAVDGPSAAGKSSLGRFLCEKLDCNLFHMDDFFLRPFQRTPERLASAGGNIDIERFNKEISCGILSGSDFSYRPYICSEEALGEAVTVKFRRLNIIEGVYSHHPDMRLEADIKVFLDVSESEQLMRLRGREDTEKYVRYVRDWLPMERRYFKWFSIKEQSHVVFSTDK